jgi:hypothetical protein
MPAALGQAGPALQTRQTRPAPDGTLVPDETAWQRSRVQFGMDRISPAQLKSEETAKPPGDSIHLLALPSLHKRLPYGI